MSLNTNVFADIPSDYTGLEYTGLEYTGLGSYTSAGQTVDKYYQWEKDTTFDFYKLKQTSNSSIADIITKEIDDRSYGGDGDVIPGWTYDSKKMNGVVFSGIGDTANMFATGQTGDGKMDEINAAYISNYSGDFPVGGAISNNMKIGDINSSFIGNFVTGRKDYSIGNNTFNGSAYGGAIYNSRANVYYAIGAETPNAIGYINSIKGDFVANYVYSQYATSDNLAYTVTYDNVYYYYEGALGGAIANQFGTINDILDSKFIQNGAFATGESVDVGGSAIYNGFLALYSYDYGWIASESKIGNISNSAFEKNLAYSENGNVYGGTILNFIGLKESSGESKISNIIENTFEENKAVANNGSIKGAVLANWNYSSKGHAIIDKISSDFINNNAIAGGNIEGTIYNNDIINEIENSKFKNNTIISTGNSSTVSGGAIYNKGSITDGIINSNFINNSATAENGTALGGAIYSSKDLTIIADNFTSEIKNNYTKDKNGKNGNSIYIDNPDATLTLNAKNNGTIFLQNGFNKESGEYNYGNIDGKSGFNTILTTENSGTIKLYDDILNSNITVKNNININTDDGIIHNYDMKKIISSRDARYVIDIDLSSADGSKLNFTVGEVADGFTSSNSSGIVTLDNLNFVNDSLNDMLKDNELKIQILKNTDDLDNLQLALNDSLQNPINMHTVTSETINLVPTVNYKDRFGEVVTTKDIEGTVNLGTTDTSNDSISIKINKLETQITSSIADTLVALTNTELKDANDNILDKTFNIYDESSSGNKTSADYKVKDNLTLGTIFKNLNIVGSNTNSVGETELSELDLNGNTFVINENSTLNFSDIELKGNAEVLRNNGGNLTFENDNIINGKISGSPATNNGTLEIKADNLDLQLTNEGVLKLGDGTITKEIDGTGTTNIIGKVINDTITISQTIDIATSGELTSDTTKLTGNINNSGKLNLSGTLDKSISGNGTTNVVGDEFTLIDGAAIAGTFNADNKTLNIPAINTDNMFNIVNINSGTLNLTNDHINDLTATEFNITGNVNVLLDVDLANTSMDRLPSTTIVAGIINVKGMNLTSDSTARNTYVPFAYDNFKNNVRTDITEIGKDVNNPYQTTTYAPIYKYNVSYNPNDGRFLFARGGGSSSGDFNPSVLPSTVNSQAGAYTAINETLNYVFRHADYSFMPLPRRIRTSMINKYSIANGRNMFYENSYSRKAGIWYQPYVTFENVHLSNGPRVDIQSYGTLVGADSEYKPLKRGWGTVTTPYIGYNGSSQHYSGVSTYTNGGILGVTQTFYKNDFFTALTVNAGAIVGEASTMYGHENFTTLMAGVASKTGYNFEFKDGKYIIQPNYMMSYSYINTFDYTNAAGVRINSDPLHTIQIHPTIKFIGNLKNGWQPYASVGMVWNLLNETKVTANNVTLPQMSIKPYVEYGVGVQKQWKDRFTGFVQALLRNGGRNGIALSFGFKWTIGKEPKSVEKVQAPVTNGVYSSSGNTVSSAKKVVIKQLKRV